MTFRTTLKKIVGFHDPDPLDDPEGKERKEWRKTIHENRNTLQRSLFATHVADKSSNAAIVRLDESTKKLQEDEFNLHALELDFLSRMKGRYEC